MTVLPVAGYGVHGFGCGVQKADPRVTCGKPYTRKVTTVETINVIATLHDFLDDHLTYREKELMHFGPMMEEHALCKFGVALRNGWI